MQGKSQYVFVGLSDQPLHQRSVCDIFLRLSDEAGPPRIRILDLRHTCASIHLAAGTNPKIVQEKFGHSSVTITLNTYSHRICGLHREATDRLSNIIGNTDA